MKPESLALFFSVALSPDGKTMATAAPYLPELIEKGQALPNEQSLLLVDLTTPDRKVTRIPAPIRKSPTK